MQLNHIKCHMMEIKVLVVVWWLLDLNQFAETNGDWWRGCTREYFAEVCICETIKTILSNGIQFGALKLFGLYLKFSLMLHVVSEVLEWSFRRRWCIRCLHFFSDLGHGSFICIVKTIHFALFWSFICIPHGNINNIWKSRQSLFIIFLMHK